MPTKVLVFESDTRFADELQVELARYGCETIVVNDASVGLQSAARDKPDLILLAIELPRMNGFSVCNKLKRDPGLKDVPLIIMSTDSSEETFEQHRRLRTRAEDYVRKPIDWADLRQRIEVFVPLPSQNGDAALLDDDETLVVEDDLEIEETGSVEIAEAEMEVETGTLTDRAFDSILDFSNATRASEPEGIEIEEADVLAEHLPGPDGALSEEGEYVLAEPLDSPARRLPAPDDDLVAFSPLEEAGLENLEELGEAEDITFTHPRADYGIQIEDAEVAPDSGLALSSFDTSESAGTADSLAAADPSELTASPLRAPAFDALEGGAPASEPSLTSAPISGAPAGNSESPASSPPSLLPPRRPSALPRGTSIPPRVAEIEARFRDELERHRTRVVQLEDDARSAQARITELEDAVRRGASKDHEVQRLQRELDEVKSKLAGSGKAGGTAREFLDLREQLNRKDKELLDLRDQLTHREKELLALRDGALSLERDKADLSDHISDLEKQVNDLSRTNDAFKNDKEAASKRADDFKRKSEKLRFDLDAKLAELAELKSLYDSELMGRSLREAEFEATAQADLEKAVLATEATEREKAEQSLALLRTRTDSERESALHTERERGAESARQALAARESELTREFESRLLAQQSQAEDASNRLREEHALSLARSEQLAAARLSQRESELEGLRQSELESAVQQHAEQVGELEVAHTSRVLELETSNAARMLEFETASASRVLELETTLQKQIADLESSHAAQLSELSGRHSRRESQLQSEHAALLQELQSTHSTRIGALETQYAAEIDAQGASYRELEARSTSQISELQTALTDRIQRVASLEADLAARTSQRDDSRREVERRDLRIEGLETDFNATRLKLESTRATLAEREGSLALANSALRTTTTEAAELKARLQQVETELTALQSAHAHASAELERTTQALGTDREALTRAREKWQSDRGALDRAKDALAAALLQIDEIEARSLE